jgi:anthranilate synthase component 1
MTDTTKAEFLEHAATRRVIPVVRRLFVDSETPMGLYRKLGDQLGSFLLESA